MNEIDRVSRWYTFWTFPLFMGVCRQYYIVIVVLGLIIAGETVVCKQVDAVDRSTFTAVFNIEYQVEAATMLEVLQRYCSQCIL